MFGSMHCMHRDIFFLRLCAELQPTLCGDYFNEELGIRSKVRRVGRTIFRSIVSNLTKGKVEARSCIDYYQDGLINENIKLLKEILRKKSAPDADVSEIVNQLDAAAGVLKYNYRNHLGYGEDEDGF